MADVFSKKKRSEVMSRIRSRGNRDTELALARLLRANGITGWRRHVAICTSPRPSPHQLASSRTTLTRSATTLSRSHGRGTGGERVRVRPDFVFPKQRLAVFVDGCFWHGCPKHSNPTKWLRKSSMPAKPVSTASTRTGRVFWQSKLSANQVRDRKVNRVLRRAGWRVLRIWEHELACKHETRLRRRIQRVLH